MQTQHQTGLVLTLSMLGLVACATTRTNVGPTESKLLFDLPAHAEVSDTPDMTVERFVIVDAPRELVYDLLVDVDAWPNWDPAITQSRTEAQRPLRPGDVFSKVEADTAITARVLEAESGTLLRWRGEAPGGIIGIHSFRLVELDGGRTLVVNREEYSRWFLRLFGWATDLGIGEQFEGTLAALKTEAESRLLSMQ